MSELHIDLNDYKDIVKLNGAKVIDVENNNEYFIVKIHLEFDSDIVQFGLSKDIRAKEPEFEIDREELVNKYRGLELAPGK